MFIDLINGGTFTVCIILEVGDFPWLKKYNISNILRQILVSLLPCHSF